MEFVVKNQIRFVQQLFFQDSVGHHWLHAMQRFNTIIAFPLIGLCLSSLSLLGSFPFLPLFAVGLPRSSFSSLPFLVFPVLPLWCWTRLCRQWRRRVSNTQ